MSSNDIPVKEIGELMDMMSGKLPGLLREIQNIMFSEEAATTMSKAVGIFYKNLVEAGMDTANAVFLTQEYMETLKTFTSQFKDS